MTSPNQHSSSAGLAWVDLDDGVTYSRAWLTTHTPGLFAAWEHAQTQQHRRQLAAQIQQAALLAESADDRDPHNDYQTVTVRWAETTLYEAEVCLAPTSDVDALWSEIANLPDAQRRTLDVTDADNRIISVVELNGDGVVNVLEQSTASEGMIDFGDIADSIDERIAESPGWPGLNRDLNTAARHRYDAAALLTALAAEAPLPAHDPAAELRYRLINTDAVPATADSGDHTEQSLRRYEPLPVHSQAASSIAALGI